MSNEDMILAVDIGTSSTRAIVFDRSGAIISKRQSCYGSIRPLPYFEEQNPNEVREKVYTILRDLLADEYVDPGKLGGIVFSSQMYGVIPIGDADEALGNAIIWSDGRAEQEAANIEREVGGAGFYRNTGCPTNSIYPLSKIVWLRNNQKELFQRTARFVSIKSFILRPLIGAWIEDYSMASASGMLDISKKTWYSPALTYAGVDVSRLPDLVAPTSAFSLVARSPLAGCGLRENIKVYPGGGDGPLANLGSGASDIGDINIDLGTSGAARSTVAAPLVDEDAALWCYCLTDRLWTYGGILTNVGNAYQWLGSCFSSLVEGKPEENVYNLLDAEARSVPAGSEGLLFLPYLRRVRSPYWDARLKATMYGMRPEHGCGHMARAMFEAISFDLKSIVRLIRKAVGREGNIVLTGGLSKSPILPQILSDILEATIFLPSQSEGSIAGAAILGLYAMGSIGSLRFEQDGSGGERGIMLCPNTDNFEIYRKQYKKFSTLVHCLREMEE